MRKLKYLSLMLLYVAMSLSFSACSDDDENDRGKLSRNELFLIAGQSGKLIYNGDCTWESDEPLIAEVDNNGNVTANRVGETIIWANDESCKITVSPKYNTYMEPYMDWGASESDITYFMNGYKYLGMNDNTLGFADMDNEIVYMYMFENNSLTASAIGVDFISKGEEITDFLLERYVVISVEGYTAIMVSIDKKIGIAVSVNVSNGLMMVLYAPFDSSDRAITKSIMSELHKQIGQSDVIKSTTGNADIMNLFKKFKK